MNHEICKKCRFSDENRCQILDVFGEQPGMGDNNCATFHKEFIFLEKTARQNLADRYIKLTGVTK